MWSRVLAPGYPDHPPMVALWIRCGTMLAGEGALGVRLLGPLSVAAATLLLADAATRLLHCRRAGLRAAALLNATLLFGVGGVLMTPDAPLLAFWIAGLWALARLLDSGDPRWWLAAGLFAGLAMASKYTAVLLWFGIGLWLLATPAMRPWLRRPAPYLGAAVGLAVFLPVLLWEAGHDWVSFARQGGRIAAWQPTHAVRFLGELVAGQFGLITPLVFLLCVAGIVQAARLAWRTRDPAAMLLLALTLPTVVLFTQHTLGNRVQGNWPAVIYPAAIIAAAGLLAPAWRRLTTPAVALGLGLTLLVYLQAGTALLPLPARLDPIAMQLSGWPGLAARIDAARLRAGATFVAADQYGVAAELARHLPPDVPVVGVEQRWTQIGLPRADVAGRTGLLIRSTRRGPELEGIPWPAPVEIGEVERQRDGEAVETFRLYRVVPAGNSAIAVTLPVMGRALAAN
ncbi:MAG: glycosyltransferase family 39 protein [Acetobacteraceae bacterium]